MPNTSKKNLKNTKLLFCFAKYGFGLFWGLFLGISQHTFGQDTLSVSEQVAQLRCENVLSIWEDSKGEGNFSGIPQKPFKPLKTAKPSWQVNQNYWLRLSLKNTSPEKIELYLDPGNWSKMEVYIWKDNQPEIIQKNGYFLPLSGRSLRSTYPYLKLTLTPAQIQTFYIKVEQKMSFYLPESLKASLHNSIWIEYENRQRLFYQGIFLGIIWVMALYNLVIFFSVRDVSTLYYVLSLIGIGLYFMFYYGFALELLWPSAPVWNAYSFSVIVPLTRITWILFTKTYLNLKTILPIWNQRLNYLIALYMVPICTGMFGYLSGIDTSDFTIAWIGVMGLIVLSMMILMGILSYQKGYEPALYFLIANMFFSVGSMMFILREVSFLTDTLFTRYSVQIGMIMQVVLFSLGLADRLNKAQQAVIQKDLEKAKLEREKETERKELIESQKIQLEKEVRQRTADLEEKTKQLGMIVQKLQESEQNLLELNHIKDKFFSIISHDLRSPLSTLNSFLNILVNLSDNFTKSEMEALAKRTQKSLGGLTELLDNLLQWARSQMNHTQFEPQAVDLEEIIHQTLDLLKVSAEEKQIQVKISLEKDISLIADQNMLSFVLRNLLINAFKFTHERGEVSIQAQKLDNRIRISIRDNGVGIPSENLSKLFHVQQHFSTRGTHNEKGIGLGLLLCKEFIEKHQGQISVQSQVNQGTTFCFELPLITYPAGIEG